MFLSYSPKEIIEVLKKQFQQAYRLPVKYYPLWGVLGIIFAVFYCLCLIDFHPSQITSLQVGDYYQSNKGGVMGAYMIYGVRFLFGIASYVWVPLFFWISILYLTKNTARLTKWFGFLVLMFVISIANWIQFFEILDVGTNSLIVDESTDVQIIERSFDSIRARGYPHGLGGIVGSLVANPFIQAYLGSLGLALLLVLLTLLSGGILFYKELIYIIRKSLIGGFYSIKTLFQCSLQIIKKFKEKCSERANRPKDNKTPPKPLVPKKSNKKQPFEAPVSPSIAPVKIISAKPIEHIKMHPPKVSGEYQFPSVDLLEKVPTLNRSKDQDYLAISNQLVKTLKQFNVEVEPSEILTGPVITRYEVAPLPGVKVEKILNLDKNIALSLKASAVRIIAPGARQRYRWH